MNEYLMNVVDQAVDQLKQLNPRPGENPYKIDKQKMNNDYYILSNGCVIGDFCAASLKRMTEGKVNIDHINIIPKLDETMEETVASDDDNIPNSAYIVFIIDCLDKKYRNCEDQEKIISRIQSICERFNSIICFAIVPQPSTCPAGLTALAEREYDVYLAEKKHKCWQEEFYLRIEEVLKKASQETNKNCILLRATNVFGPGCDNLVHSVDWGKISTEIKEERKVVLKEGDISNHFSYTDAFLSVYSVLIACARFDELNHRVYNVVTESTTEFDLKVNLYRAFRETVTLNSFPITPSTEHFHNLSGIRIKGLLSEYKLIQDSLEETLYQQVAYSSNIPYDMRRGLAFYEGRLNIIRDAEKNLLSIVDKICRENNIQYFLAGGSALGAVRHQDMIPWDDDVDIGMLRGEYERFRRIVPQSLPNGITYEAANGPTGSHYHFDKIRLNETYFSTQYSSFFTIPDGIFLDVLVYDKTSNIPAVQQLQIRLTSMWTRVMNIKWVNKPRKNIHYRLSKLALPIMRKISWNWFHWIFERIVRQYEHKKNAEYVIDSMGMNIKRGVLRREWMTDVVMVPFGDMMAPIPRDYDSYCRHFYGNHYMEVLSIGRRFSNHLISRLDVAPYLYSSEYVRKLDIHGELLEEDN